MNTPLWAGRMVLLLLPMWVGAQHPNPHPADHQGCTLQATEGTPFKSGPYRFKGSFRTKAPAYDIKFFAEGETIDGITCREWPAEARVAMEYAASIWSDALQNEQPFEVHACFTPFASGTQQIGSASTPYRTIADALDKEKVAYPKVIYEVLTGKNSSGRDIRLLANSRTDFYYGTDRNVGENQIDFVTFALHELGHGLGFVGPNTVRDGIGRIGVYTGEGENNESIYAPSIFDLQVELGGGAIPLVELPNPSSEMELALTGVYDGLYLNLERVDTYSEASDRLKLYTPPGYQSGSSYVHFENDRELMSRSIVFGRANHQLGSALTVLQNMGWGAANQVAAPVTLTAFTGRPVGQEVVLDWQTDTETDNEHFTVERSADGLTFSALGQLAGRGTTRERQEYTFTDRTPSPGPNYYRLRQQDYDGTVDYSEVIDVSLTVELPVVGQPYPNPTPAATAYLSYLSDRERRVTLRLLDVAGRIVRQHVYSLGAGRHRLTLPVHELEAGVYVIHLEDGTSSSTRRLAIK